MIKHLVLYFSTTKIWLGPSSGPPDRFDIDNAHEICLDVKSIVRPFFHDKRLEKQSRLSYSNHVPSSK